MPRIVPSQVVGFIDKVFPFAVEPVKRVEFDQGHASQLATLIHLVEQIPNEVIVLDPTEYTMYITSLVAIKTSLSMWQGTERRHVLDRTPGLGKMNPVTVVRSSLTKCPDEAIIASTAELPFIRDEDLKEELRKDISAANQALSNAEWKAATILAGATLEALLLWVLQERQKQNSQDIASSVSRLVSRKTLKKEPGAKIEEWTLHPLIETAYDLGEIKEETLEQSRLAKGFRNLIHPGRSARLGQKCNRATALSAVAALEHVVIDLTDKYTP